MHVRDRDCAVPACFLVRHRVADAHWGRYKTIVVFVVVYLCGMVTLTLSAARTLSTEAGVFVALTLVAMGTGGIKANVSRTFDAEAAARFVLGVVRVRRVRAVHCASR